MLTINDVIKLYKEGVNVEVKKGKHPKGLKGVWELEERTVKLYAPAIKSEDDKNITLIHEFLHAKDHLLLDVKSIESKIEKNAIITYNNKPQIAKFIRWLYRI